MVPTPPHPTPHPVEAGCMGVCGSALQRALPVPVHCGGHWCLDHVLLGIPSFACGMQNHDQLVHVCSPPLTCVTTGGRLRPGCQLWPPGCPYGMCTNGIPALDPGVLPIAFAANLLSHCLFGTLPFGAFFLFFFCLGLAYKGCSPQKLCSHLRAAPPWPVLSWTAVITAASLIRALVCCAVPYFANCFGLLHSRFSCVRGRS